MTSTKLDLRMHTDPDELCKCQDCGTEAKLSELDPIDDLEQRIAPGEVVPAGQCGECGALSHLAAGPSQPQVLVEVIDGCVEEIYISETGVKVTVVDVDAKYRGEVGYTYNETPAAVFESSQANLESFNKAIAGIQNDGKSPENLREVKPPFSGPGA